MTHLKDTIHISAYEPRQGMYCMKSWLLHQAESPQVSRAPITFSLAPSSLALTTFSWNRACRFSTPGNDGSGNDGLKRLNVG